jgi:branched-chain amino acid transport system permease protein
MAFGAFSGTVALLLAALIIIRIMPNGISASLQKYFDRRTGGTMQ